jgi:hypothetical protein
MRAARAVASVVMRSSVVSGPSGPVICESRPEPLYCRGCLPLEA